MSQNPCSLSSAPPKYDVMLFIQGFVPVYNPHSYDLSYGLAEGRDLVGPFSHFTGPFGPFGFWANLLHDKK